MPGMNKEKTGPLRLRCDFEFKGAMESKESNVLKGVAATIGRINQGGNVLFPGFFGHDCLARFLQRGFVPIGHKWHGLPVAMPTKAEATPEGLMCEAEFHSHQEAQDARAVCMERLQKGLAVGLSVGMLIAPDDYHLFESGEKLLAFAKDNGYDLSKFDVTAIRAWEDWCCALIKCRDLWEFSIVTIPMDLDAGARMAASMDATNDLLEMAQGKPTRLQDHLDSVRVAVQGAIARLQDWGAMKGREGKTPDPERVAQAKDLLQAVEGLIQAVRPVDPEQIWTAKLEEGRIVLESLIEGWSHAPDASEDHAHSVEAALARFRAVDMKARTLTA